LRIIKVEAIPLTLPLRESRTSRGAWSPVYTYVRITTDDGIVGIGEGGFAKAMSYGETQGTVMELIHNVIGPELLGENPFDVDRLYHKMDRTICWHWVAKTGVDYALHDIVGKALGTPVYNLLGGRAREKAALSRLVSAVDSLDDEKQIEGVIKFAVDSVKAGFHMLKLKVGLADPSVDIEAFRLIREAVGSKVPMMVDANQAWDPVTAVKTIRQLEKYDLFAVESPVPEWDLVGLCQVHESVDAPIVADEVARSTEGAINIIRARAADMFRLHLAKAGGFLKSREYVAIAEAADMPVFVGLMGEAGLGNAANAHFVVAMEWLGKLPHSCVGPLNLFETFDTLSIEKEHKDVIKGYARIENGFIYPPEGPGLGVELDDEKVRQYLTPGKQILVCERR
jgi:L-alanine-DL-glutamate epimerase-like enolase superfamily enzyme